MGHAFRQAFAMSDLASDLGMQVIANKQRRCCDWWDIPSGGSVAVRYAFAVRSAKRIPEQEERGVYVVTAQPFA